MGDNDQEPTRHSDYEDDYEDDNLSFGSDDDGYGYDDDVDAANEYADADTQDAATAGPSSPESGEAPREAQPPPARHSTSRSVKPIEFPGASQTSNRGSSAAKEPRRGLSPGHGPKSGFQHQPRPPPGGPPPLDRFRPNLEAFPFRPHAHMGHGLPPFGPAGPGRRGFMHPPDDFGPQGFPRGMGMGGGMGMGPEGRMGIGPDGPMRGLMGPRAGAGLGPRVPPPRPPQAPPTGARPPPDFPPGAGPAGPRPPSIPSRPERGMNNFLRDMRSASEFPKRPRAPDMGSEAGLGPGSASGPGGRGFQNRRDGAAAGQTPAMHGLHPSAAGMRSALKSLKTQPQKPAPRATTWILGQGEATANKTAVGAAPVRPAQVSKPPGAAPNVSSSSWFAKQPTASTWVNPAVVNQEPGTSNAGAEGPKARREAVADESHEEMLYNLNAGMLPEPPSRQPAPSSKAEPQPQLADTEEQIDPEEVRRLRAKLAELEALRNNQDATPPGGGAHANASPTGRDYHRDREGGRERRERGERGRRRSRSHSFGRDPDAGYDYERSYDEAPRRDRGRSPGCREGRGAPGPRHQQLRHSQRASPDAAPVRRDRRGDPSPMGLAMGVDDSPPEKERIRPESQAAGKAKRRRSPSEPRYAHRRDEYDDVDASPRSDDGGRYMRGNTDDRYRRKDAPGDRHLKHANGRRVHDVFTEAEPVRSNRGQQPTSKQDNASSGRRKKRRRKAEVYEDEDYMPADDARAAPEPRGSPPRGKVKREVDEPADARRDDDRTRQERMQRFGHRGSKGASPEPRNGRLPGSDRARRAESADRVYPPPPDITRRLTKLEASEPATTQKPESRNRSRRRRRKGEHATQAQKE